MPDVKVTGVIRAEPEKVFAFVANLENWPRWQADMKTSKLVSGEAGQSGAKYHYTAAAMGQSFDSTVEIVSVAPGRSVSFEGEWQGMIRPRGTYLVEAAPEGTRFTAHLTPETRGLGKLLSPLMGLMIRKINQQHLEALRRALE
jgi:uncharacterized protein YndB with AHSA1/START domain